MTPSDYQPFPTPQDLWAWLDANHAGARELWVRIYKKETGVASVTWEDCVIASIAWGWIDGQKQSLDDQSYLQRLTPRRPGSNWSKKNCDHAERLMADGKMQPSGRVHVDAARSDGRWDTAYAGSSAMEIPADFLAALDEDPAARDFYATLNRANLFAIYHRLHTAKRPETRARRMEQILHSLRSGKPLH